MRTVLHHEFEQLIYNTSYQQVQFLHKHPEVQFFTHFDFTRPFGVPTQVHQIPALAATQPDELKLGMATLPARAARSGGRFELHVILVAEGRERRLHMFPLRSASGAFHDGLRRIATAVGNADFSDAFPQVHHNLTALINERDGYGVVIH
jgi:hypothetical protein